MTETSATDMAYRPPQPGDLCMFLFGGKVMEHVAPCPDGHATGVCTEPLTGRVVQR